MTTPVELGAASPAAGVASLPVLRYLPTHQLPLAIGSDTWGSGHRWTAQPCDRPEGLGVVLGPLNGSGCRFSSRFGLRSATGGVHQDADAEFVQVRHQPVDDD